MKIFIRKPLIDLVSGVKVTKDTKLDYKNDNVEQTVNNLVLHTVTKVKGEGYEGLYDTTVYLEEGDVLVFEEEGRGYIKPLDNFVTVEEAIDDLLNIKDIGEEKTDVSD